VEDLLRWDRVLASNRFLSPSTRERLVTPVRNNYACGWWVGPSQQGRTVQWHRGNIPGFVAIISRYPREQLFVAVLSNFARTPVRSIANELAAIALGEPYELPYERKEIAVDPTTVDAFFGEYRKVGQSGDIFRFLRDGNRFLVQPAGVPPFEVVPESPERFFSRSIDFQLTFVRNADGSVKHVVIRREAETSRWIRTR
jgi:hypothetical protein